MERLLSDPALARTSRREGVIAARARVQLGRQRGAPDRRYRRRSSAGALAARDRCGSASTRGSCSATRPASAAISASCCAAGRRGPTPRSPAVRPLRARSRCRSTFRADTTVDASRRAGAGRGTWWEQTHLRRAVRARSARRLLRAGLHGAARLAGAAGRDHPRHLVRRASRVVPPARRACAGAG